MTYQEARVYLDEASKYGSVLGLVSIRRLLARLGDPQDSLPVIHIAGTNGKGSVSAMISTILSEAGFRTGRYISPAVFSELETIQVDGRQISEEGAAEIVEQIQEAVARMETDKEGRPTVFELETAMAFLYFKKKGCDLAVIETGLGGSLDATNIVSRTVVAVFTSIGRDHIGVLGDTLEEIAEQKAGILKPGCVAVSAWQTPEVRRVLERRARECGCPIVFADPQAVEVTEQGFRGQTFSYKGMEQIRLGLAGEWQIVNAATAWEAVHALGSVLPLQVSEAAVRRGFAETVWKGRFTCICERPLFFVDGAHNEAAARSLRRSVERYFPGKRPICIMGVFQDKEYEKIAEIIAPCAAGIFTVDLPDRRRSLDAQILKETLERYREPGQAGTVRAVGDIRLAVREALEAAAPEDVILAFGSLSYLGQVTEAVQELTGGKERRI